MTLLHRSNDFDATAAPSVQDWNADHGRDEICLEIVRRKTFQSTALPY
jgi:hypothetical protein